MTRSAKLVLTLAVAATLALAAATPSQAISTALAKKCRAMMVQAHPTELFGRHGSAAEQRAYFKECVSRQGRMDEGAQSGTTGSGGAASTTGRGKAR